MATGLSAFAIGSFDKALHDRSAFSCDHTRIDNFFKQSFSEAHKADYIRAFVATTDTDNVVLGFYALQAHSIQSEHLPQLKKLPPTIPAIYLKAVAVDRTCQGQGLGTTLIVDALRRSVDLADHIAAAVIVLDVLHGDDQDARRRAFYEGIGFQTMNDPDNPHRMFIRTKDVRASLTP